MSDRGARRLSTRIGIASAALAAGAGATMAAPDGLLWTRAAIEGFVAGGRVASDAVLSLLRHPAAALRGATIAADHHVEGLKEWVEAGAAYTTAWRVDPVSFATISFTLVGCAAACVVAAWGFERVTDRVALALVRAARDRTRHIRSSRRGPIIRLWRARAMRLEQRRGQRASGVRASLQRISWWARDLADGLRLLVAQPVPATGFAVCQMMWIVVSVASRVLRLGCQQIAYLALPIVLLAVPWIDFSIHLDEVAGAAERDIAPAARRFVDEVAELSIADLPVRTGQMRARYAEHRQRLLVPISDLDLELDRDLHALNRTVAAGGLDERTIDYRMERLLIPYASRKLLMIEQIFLHPSDTPHGPYTPSDNWLESIRDEQALFEAARARTARSESQRYLDEIIAAVAGHWSYESCILLDDPEQLLKRPLPSSHPRCGAPQGSERTRP